MRFPGRGGIELIWRSQNDNHVTTAARMQRVTAIHISQFFFHHYPRHNLRAGIEQDRSSLEGGFDLSCGQAHNRRRNNTTGITSG